MRSINNISPHQVKASAMKTRHAPHHAADIQNANTRMAKIVVTLVYIDLGHKRKSGTNAG
jgi:hypothetical protein